MFSGAGKFDRELFPMQMSRESLHCNCLTVSSEFSINSGFIDFLHLNGKFCYGIIKPILLQQFFPQSMASIQLDKHDIMQSWDENTLFHDGVMLQSLLTRGLQPCCQCLGK